jgi:mannosyltransferase OCH1-like enzyme
MTDAYPTYTVFFDSKFIPEIKIMEQLYDNYIVHNFQYDQEARIPKIIHQTWFGGEVPEKYHALQESWKKNHPDWQYILWTKEKIDEFGLIHKEIFDEATNYATKSDIARIEILYRMGGLYADMDTECLKPMDIFHHCCDFYSCGPIVGSKGIYVPIEMCLFGSRPGHPILKKMIEGLKTADPKATGRKIMNESGPVFFGKKIFEALTKQPLDRVVIFPTSYFLTLPHDVGYPDPNLYKDKSKIVKWIREETYVVHYWHTNWGRHNK